MAAKSKGKRAPKPANSATPITAEELENALLPTPAPERSSAKRQDANRAKSMETPDCAGDAPSVPQAKRAGEIPPVPPEIRERFIGIGSEYYFPDGAPAFKDHGRKLTTPSENTEVIRSMVSIAQSRGWNDLTVKGTERFRKDAWFAAQLAGITVRGYEPTAFEREHAVRAIGRRAAGAAGRTVDVDAVQNGGQLSGAMPGARLGDREAGERPERASSNRRPESDSASIAGRLVDHGRANYRHDPKEPPSYFVRLETARGDVEIWGVDLERAFRESLTRPTIGDDVTARATGRDRVKIPVDVRDDQGRVIGKDEIEVHRNRWIVERSEFLVHRAALAKVLRDPNIGPEEGTKRFPELQGSYLQLQVAKQGAQRDITHPEDRTRFVERARHALAEAIERGDPMEPVRLRERAPGRAAEPRKPARDIAPTR